MAVVSRSWKNDADLEESVSMSLVAKLSRVAMLMAGGSIPSTVGWRKASRRGRRRRERKGRKRTNKTRKTHMKCM